MSDYRSLTKGETVKLAEALRGNVENDRFIRMGRDTTFLDEEPDEAESETINAIRSIPVHYHN